MTDCPKMLVEWVNRPACQQSSTKSPGRKASEPPFSPSPALHPHPIAGITSLNAWDSRRARNILDSCSLGSGGKDSPHPCPQPLRCPGSIRNETGCVISTLLFNIIWRYQQGQKVKRGVAGIKNGREEIRLSLSIGNMIVCIEHQNNL